MFGDVNVANAGWTQTTVFDRTGAAGLATQTLVV
jgi:hypothetical protein